MKREPCIVGCKYLLKEKNMSDDGPGYQDQCVLYGITLNKMSIPDAYDPGVVSVCSKCSDCMEKELSCSIDEKIREVYSFYKSFTQEMDIQFRELELMALKREDIYK